MKVHELSKRLKITNKELLRAIDDPRVKSHLSNVPEDILSQYVEEKKIEEAEPELTQTADSAETVILGATNEAKIDSIENVQDVDCESPVESNGRDERAISDDLESVSEHEECPYSLEQVELGCRGCGGKSPMWKWRHLIA